MAEWKPGQDILDFDAYLYKELELASIYVLGGQGERVVDILPRIPSMETTERVKQILQRIKDNFLKLSNWSIYNAHAFDCSGLGTVYFIQKKLIPGDTTADGLYEKYCTPIKKSELRDGDMVFQQGTKTVEVTDDKTGKKIKKQVKYMHHVGYYVGGGKVIEAKGRLYGVVESEYNTNNWSHAGRPKFWGEGPKPGKIVISRELYYKTDGKTLMHGDDVKALQIRLNELKYNCGSNDGIFGKNTDIAVRNYQSDNKLTVDGIAGKNTLTKLGFEWGGG